MKISKKFKIVSIIFVILAVIVALVAYFLSNIFSFTSSVSDIEKELNNSYVLTDIVKNMPSNEDLSSLITKLNNNVSGMVINGKLNVMQDFRFNEDFNLTINEFCCLLNMVQNHINEDDTFKFDKLNLLVNDSSINKFNLSLFFEIDKTSLNRQLKINLQSNILLEIEYSKNKNGITQTSKINSINGIKYENASEELKDFINNLNNINIYDDVINDMQSIFNCYYELNDNFVKIYA